MAETKKTLIGNIKGPQGDTGDKGDKGDTGATGQRGSGWTQGLAITGTSTDGTVFPNSGIEDALVNDNYLNTYTGNTYRCILGGDASTAEWVYTGNLKGPAGELVVDTELDSESENPVQNKVIAESLSQKQNLLAKGHAEDVSNNLNLIVDTGVYLIGDTTIFTNLPEDLQGEGYCELVVFNSSVYVVQEIFTHNVNSGKIYYRFKIETEDSWNNWQEFGSVFDGFNATVKGFSADATQLNKEVEGSYAAGVAAEISGINSDLAQKTAFLLPYADSNSKTNALNISYTYAWSDINQTCYVKRGVSNNMPADCEFGIREVYYHSYGKVGLRITGVDTTNNPATWSAFYDLDKGWYAWLKDFRDSDFVTSAQFLQDIPHSSKIEIPYGGCQNIVGCLFNRVVTLNLYFNIKEDIDTGETIFTLPEIYRPNYETVALSFGNTNMNDTNYSGGIASNGIIYSNTSIPAGICIVINVSYMKH